MSKQVSDSYAASIKRFFYHGFYRRDAKSLKKAMPGWVEGVKGGVTKTDLSVETISRIFGEQLRRLPLKGVIGQNSRAAVKTIVLEF
ncbi:hypothetical protein FJZ53_02030 [Candidatus Woesearchaeota archaeon]|nr:hypothetical protein [Candidatus Woesearchaeota archaeon]